MLDSEKEGHILYSKRSINLPKKDPILGIFKKSKALLSGHFLLSSGLHSGTYFEKFAVIKRPEYLQLLCKKMSNHFKKQKIDVVIGPTTGGMLIAYEVAKNLKKQFMFAESEGDPLDVARGQKRVLKRGFELKPPQKVLIVDDILTTGKSVQEVIDLVNGYGAKIIGIGVLLDRSGGKVNFGYPFFALATTKVENYQPENCPLCQKGVELVKPGSRKIM